MNRGGSAVFSLVSTDSVNNEGRRDDPVLEDMINADDTGGEYEESDSEYAVGGEEFCNDDDGTDLVDNGLAAVQDSVKTVITQSFRACSYAADSVASLVLKAHDYNDNNEVITTEQTAGASSSENTQTPTTVAFPPPPPLPTTIISAKEDQEECEDEVGELRNEHSAIEREELRIKTRKTIGGLPKNVSSEAFQQLFQDLDDSTFTFASTGTPPGRLPNDFQLNFLNSSGSEGDGMMLEDVDAPQTDDDDAYTEIDPLEDRQTPQQGFIRVSVQAISRKLKKPIAYFFPSDAGNANDWSSTPSSAVPYYFTPPVTPFDGHVGGGFRQSFRKMSIGSFNSIKDALSSWRNSHNVISTTRPVPNYAMQQSGLFEDIEMFLLERVDLTFFAARSLARKIKKDGKRFRLVSTNSSQHDVSVSTDSEKRKVRPVRRRSKLSISRFVKGMVTLRIPKQIFCRVHKGVTSTIRPVLESASRRFVHLENVDELEGVGEIVRRQGYPYQEVFVCTRDGYILRLERLPNPGSKKVLYMQHGVMDSSFTWVANGADSSLAFRAHDAGYDVFLGNFRGAGGDGARRHVKTDISDLEYWDFSINEHAFEDIPAFVNAIVRTKVAEDSTSKPHIVGVFHSMGGAAGLMYVLNQREKKAKHFLDGMVLVSPAGIHVESPLYARAGGRLVDLTIAKMVNSLRLPTDALTRGTVKLVQDIKSSVPALEDIISLALVYGLGGDKNAPRKGPFSTVQQLTYNVLTCGTSTKVYTHLRQFITTRRFQAFDYEPTAYPNHFSSKEGGNMEAYGTPHPPEYTSQYGKIDCPVHLIAGLGDKLIGAPNIMRHYSKMKEKGVDVTIESFEHCGHADFTCGLNSAVLRGLLEAINKVTDKGLANKENKATLQELKRKNLITPHF